MALFNCILAVCGSAIFVTCRDSSAGIQMITLSIIIQLTETVVLWNRKRRIDSAILGTIDGVKAALFVIIKFFNYGKYDQKLKQDGPLIGKEKMAHGK